MIYFVYFFSGLIEKITIKTHTGQLNPQRLTVLALSWFFKRNELRGFACFTSCFFRLIAESDFRSFFCRFLYIIYITTYISKTWNIKKFILYRHQIKYSVLFYGVEIQSIGRVPMKSLKGGIHSLVKIAMIYFIIYFYLANKSTIE